MQQEFERLADVALAAHKRLQRRVLIGLAGSPGSGKTTTAYRVCQEILKKHGAPIAVVVPMDGFHLYKRELDAMDDPAEAYKRRGAPWTFNPTKFFTLLHAVKAGGAHTAPSFDHKVGDAVEDDIQILNEHQIIIVEGNYIFMDDPVWRDIGALLDERWFVDIPIDQAMQRVVERHIGTGLSRDKAIERVETNDRPNGELVIEKSKNQATLLVQSIEDPFLVLI